MIAIAPQNNITLTAVFKPLDWQIAPWRYIGPQLTMLLTGSAGGGKSRIAAEKLHGYCLKYEGAQALTTRATRESMTNGTIPYIERQIIGDDPRVKHLQGRSRFEYLKMLAPKGRGLKSTTGSSWAYMGLNDEKDRTKLRSFGQDGGADIVWMEEAIEYTYEDYNEVKTRMRGKAGAWRQIILTTNPDADSHWINVYLIEGKGAKVFYSQSADNPYNPQDYQNTLAEMTGVRALRMREGKWVKASGVVYDQWLDDFGIVGSDKELGNVTERAEYIPDPHLTYFWAVDDGYAGETDPLTGRFKANAHPRVFLLGQVHADGTIAIFAENYAVKKLSTQHLVEIREMGYPDPDWAVVDKSAAELKGRLNGESIYTKNGAPTVEESIKILQALIAPDPQNGVRRFIVHPRCKHLRSEFNSYRRDPLTEKPIKEFDHGVDAARYLAHVLKNNYGV